VDGILRPIVSRRARDEAKAPRRPIANRPQDAILPYIRTNAGDSWVK
jgi:hypothetical protein